MEYCTLKLNTPFEDKIIATTTGRKLHVASPLKDVGVGDNDGHCRLINDNNNVNLQILFSYPTQPLPFDFRIFRMYLIFQITTELKEY